MPVMDMRWFGIGLAICAGIFVLAGVYAIEQGSNVPFKTIAKGYFCKYHGEDNYVIRDPESFKEILEKAGLVVNDKIDFEREMVIAVFYGWKPTAGYDITIKSIHTSGDLTALTNENVMVVTVVKKKPGENCYLPQLITAPYHIVKLPRFDGEVVFKELTAVEDCQ